MNLYFKIKGDLWEISDCDPPSADCVSINLPESAQNSQVVEEICCASPQMGIT